MFSSKKKLPNGKQLAQLTRDENYDYQAVRFAIREGNKDAANMLERYIVRYSAYASNIHYLQALLAERSKSCLI